MNDVTTEQNSSQPSVSFAPEQNTATRIPTSGDTPQVSVPPSPPSTETPLPKKKGVPILAIVGAVILFLVAFVSIGLLSSRSTTNEQPRTQATPTAFATPTPVLNQSALATTSAFLDFSSENASFAGILNTFVLQDPSLAPPVLETEVDFK